MQSLEPVTVSPNPFTDKVNISFQQPAGKEILFELFDSFGHPLVNKKTIADGSKQTFSFDVPANLTPGNYILIISADKKSITRYLLKK